MITNCSNNYGPWQFPEKLIPVVILKAAAGEAIPLYGDGQNVRDATNSSQPLHKPYEAAQSAQAIQIRYYLNDSITAPAP